MTRATSATSATAARTAEECAVAACPRARAAMTAVRSPPTTWTPTAAGTCWSRITAAIPTVNPSTTGHGT